MLSESLMAFMMKIYHKEEANKASTLEGTKLIQRVMNHIGGNKLIMLNSLGSKIQQNVDPEDQESWLQESTLIEFFQEKLLKEEEVTENKELLHRILSLLIHTFADILTSKACLLAGLNLALSSVKKLISYPRTPEETKSLESNISSYNLYFSSLCGIIRNNNTYEKVYESSIMLMIYLYKLVETSKDTSWVGNLCESVTYDGYFLCSTGGIVRVLELGSVDPIYRVLKERVIDESRVKKNNYVFLTLQKLWELLSYPHYHNKVVPFILKLSKEFPKLLSDVISQSFASYTQHNQELVITKFAVFWRLSGRHKELLSSKELNDLNKLGLFLMLDFLDHSNPLVKHTTKQWIS